MQALETKTNSKSKRIIITSPSNGVYLWAVQSTPIVPDHKITK